MGANTSSIIVNVPKDQQGKIIGTRGNTIKDIHSDYPGVCVTVPRKHDPSTIVTIKGPKIQVKRAKARILDILGLSKTNYRDTANSLRAQAGKLFESANHPGISRNKRRKLLNQAHELKRQYEFEDRAAAAQIFAVKNSGYELNQMDLHGLFLKEAIEYVQERLKMLFAGQVPGHELEIITGKGIHSAGQRAKIKPAVENLLQNEKQRFSYVCLGEGGFKVSLVETQKEQISRSGCLQSIIIFFQKLFRT